MELTALLERMKMEHLLAQLDGVCEHAAKGDLDYKGFLTHALEAEWRGRHQRGVESRLKLARLPWVKPGSVCFDFQPSIDRNSARARRLSLSSGRERRPPRSVGVGRPPWPSPRRRAVEGGTRSVPDAGGHGRLVRTSQKRLARILSSFAYPRAHLASSGTCRHPLGAISSSGAGPRYERAIRIVTSNKASWTGRGLQRPDLARRSSAPPLAPRTRHIKATAPAS